MELFAETTGIKYFKLNLPALKQFIEDPSFRSLPNLPISRHRALSYLHNPRAVSSDYVMYLAYANETLVGYRLMFPDEIRAGSETIRIAWFSCVWVHRGYRGKGIAKKLVDEAKADWKDLILLQGPVTASKGLYTQSGNINHPYFLEGIRCHVRWSLGHLVPQRFPKLKWLAQPLRWIDAILNVPINLIQSRKQMSPRHEFLSRFTEESNRFIETVDDQSLTQRRANELNWMLHYPWVITSPVEMPMYQKRYYFSATAREYRFLSVHLYDDQSRIIAVLLYSMREGHLSLQYAFYEKQHVRTVWKFTGKLVHSLRAHTFTTYCQVLTPYLQSTWTSSLWKRKTSRLYGISDPLQEWLDQQGLQPAFHAGDGDAGLV